MAKKAFEIQGSDLKLGGVSLQAGTTGVVIPGVTQAANYKVEEVEDTDEDQTYQFAVDSGVVVIDAALYNTIVAEGNESTFADFTATTDDEGYIDEIEVNGQGTYTQQLSTTAGSNDMYAYVGAGSASDRPLVSQDWIQIPFRPKMRAGEVENVGGGGSVGGLESFTNNEGDPGELSYSLILDEQVAIRVHYSSGGEPNNGFTIGRGNENSTRANGVVAIGNDDVGYQSAPGGVYIGYQAGFLSNEDFEGGQGENAIAIGAKAAYSLALDNSITLNATGQDLSPTESGLFIKPIREEAYDDNTVYYDPTTGELTYAATSTNSLAPLLTEVEGTVVANANIQFGDNSNGLIAVVDSGGESGQWFNYAVSDSDGVLYACGTNDDNPQYVWAFNTDGTVKWKIGIDDIDTYNAVPRTLSVRSESLVVSITFNTSAGEREIGVITLNKADGTVNESYVLSTNNIGSKRVRDFAIDGSGNHILVGSLDGENISENNIAPVKTSWGSNVNILTVANSSLSSPILPWDWNLEVQNNPLDANAWYSPDSINYFRDLPVTSVTGTGGPQTYAETTDYAAGKLQLVVSDSGTTTILRLDATWVDGAAQSHLLAQTGTYSYTIVCSPGTYVAGQTNSWVDVGGGIYEAPLSVSGIISDGTYDITSLLINKSVMTVELRYVPAGQTNGSSTGGAIDVYNVQFQGQGYAAGDVVKVFGSQMGGVNTVTLSGTTWTASNNSASFLIADYPGFSVVQNGWRMSGPGITGWATLSEVQNTGATWRFDVPQGIVLEEGQQYTIDNNGNDITLTLADYGSGPYANFVDGKVSDQVAATTRIIMSQGVDYRGAPSGPAFTNGVEYTTNAGLYTDFANGTSGSLMLTYSLWSDTAARDAMLALGTGDVLIASINSGSEPTPRTFTFTNEWAETFPGVWQIDYTTTVSESSGWPVLSAIIPDGITFTGTWNLRRSLNSQAFIRTDTWAHTYGGVADWENFTSVVYDSFDNSVYALGGFYNGSNEIALFKFNYETGDTVWVKYVEDDAGDGNDAGSVAVDGAGSVYTSATNNDGKTIVTKLTSTGTLVWQVLQANSDEWNNQPSMVLDTNGDIIVGGSYYNQNDPTDNHTLWSFMKLSKTDGSLIWARYLDNEEKYAMYDMEDYGMDSMTVQGDDICYAGMAYDTNDNYYVALAFKFNTNGQGLGTYGRWIWSEDPNASWSSNTSNAVVITATIPEVDQTTFTLGTASLSVTPNAVGAVTPSGYTLGTPGNLEFNDGSELTTAGIARHSVEVGGGSITLSAAMNGKFVYYYSPFSGQSSNIIIPANSTTPLPIGFTLTVVVGEYNGQAVYVNNDFNEIGDVGVKILVSGSSDFSTNYWVFDSGTAGIYTIMKIDTDTWMLAGPSISVD